ncbi:hypothetical protein HYH02_000491 [Chlamydomonas schloesseri]|uniref:Uncharacterized protein n=1 Tax=Chlamydomonas schloesseri TaxID=2026947 RepID=A0A835WY03_9CHLO|nr:hypothetical protein HYH02_000491 [Chlamydomonas schloesseri]|eukprot:KAG2454651.1 hypothetical protein HYH02_000491 [Chlamydomonas schloesseri]
MSGTSKADELSSWAERLRAINSAPGSQAPNAAAAAPISSATSLNNAGATSLTSGAEAGLEPSLPTPTVPHLFVQRLDALPEPTMEQLLLAMDRLASKTAQAQQPQQQRGWLASLFGGGGGDGGSGGAASGGDPAGGGGGSSRSEVRRLLRQWRQQELAADADTADFSSDPYDTIPRQVELQWRTYAKLYPEDAAARARAAALLPQPGPSSAAAGSSGGGASAAIGGWLPSAAQLQHTLSAITAAPAAAAARPVPGGGGGPAAAGAAAGSISSSAAAAAAAVAPPSPAREWVARHARQQPVVPFSRDLTDPDFLRLLVSLEAWYGQHLEALAPLRRGRRGRLLAVRGVPLPADWRLQRAAGGRAGGRAGGGGGGGAGGGGGCGGWPGAGLLRWCAGAVGLRTRPRVWEVLAAGQGEEERQEAQERRQQPGGPLAATGAAGRSGPGAGALGVGAAAAGLRPRGLQAAQEAAAAGQFALRRVTLVPADWL